MRRIPTPPEEIDIFRRVEPIQNPIRHNHTKAGFGGKFSATTLRLGRLNETNNKFGLVKNKVDALQIPIPARAGYHRARDTTWTSIKTS